MTNWRWSLFGLLLWGAVLPTQTAAGTSKLESYTAKYRVTRGSFVIGQATIILKISGKNQYDYKGYTKPVGLVAVFRKDEITEASRGTINELTVKPETYRYKHKKSKKTRQVDLVFDWANKRVANRAAGSDWSMSIPTSTQDKFSQQLALMMRLNQGKHESSFQVADGGRLKTYHFKVDGQAHLKTEAGEYKALKVIRKKGKRPSRAIFWMAPELNHIPIRVVKRESDGEFMMELQTITWPERHERPTSR